MNVRGQSSPTSIAVPGASGVSAVSINGVAQTSSQWTVSSGYQPAIVFAAPPADNAIVTADFVALWLCRFANDMLDFEEFMAMLFGTRDSKTERGAALSVPPSFPTLAGQGWSVHKKPIFSTLIASHVSGREVRDALYQNPIWEFELKFDGTRFRIL